MTSSLLDLTSRLQRSVPIKNGVPADYGQLVMDAVNQLGMDVPVITSWQFTTVAGQASYDLPNDFTKLIELAPPTSANGVLISNSGLIPITDQWVQNFYIEGMVLRFDPAPQGQITQVLRYAATYLLEETGVFNRLSENAARIALLYAQYLALMEQANLAAGNSWSYRLGDESVDKRGQGTAVLTQASEMLKNYQAAIKPLQGYGSKYRPTRLDPDAY